MEPGGRPYLQGGELTMQGDITRRRLMLDTPSGFLLLFFVMPLIALVVLSFWQTE